jgi:hypothetical protein
MPDPCEVEDPIEAGKKHFPRYSATRALCG